MTQKNNISRRSFLKKTAVLSTAAGVAPVSTFGKNAENTENTENASRQSALPDDIVRSIGGQQADVTFMKHTVRIKLETGESVVLNELLEKVN